MTGNSWQELFENKGWLDGNCVIAPAGCALYIQFRDNKATLAIQSTADPRQQVVCDDTFIIERNKDPRGEWRDEIYHLWDDIIAARLVVFTD
jgi:hypothetical protein